MKTQRFQNDEEYLAYVRKNAKDERLLYYTYVIFGIFMIAMMVNITLNAVYKINTDLETMAVVAVISPIGVFKLKKSGWLERKENKTVELASIRLEQRRKKLIENGADVILQKYEKNIRGVLQFGTYALLGGLSLVFSHDLAYLLIGFGISAIISTIFIKTKYFKLLLEKGMAQNKRDLAEGYVYGHSF